MKRSPLKRTELVEQMVVAQWLTAHKVTFTATANGAFLGGRTLGARMKTWRKLAASGVQKGVPDLLIFDPPPALPSVVGVAIEMKLDDKQTATPEQKHWLGRLIDCGWVAEVAHGSSDAIRILKQCGYGRRAA